MKRKNVLKMQSYKAHVIQWGVKVWRENKYKIT